MINSKVILIHAVLSLTCLGAVSLEAQNGDQTESARVEQMLARMTLQEKISLLGGRDMETVGIASVGLRPLRMSDGPMGIKGREPALALPGGLCLAATWNVNLAHAMGETLGQEARSRGIDILLGPGVNMVRVPVAGRNFEYFGEDPKLSADIAVGYIQGVQQQGVIATVKHLAANNSEFDRHNTDSIVDERTLHELYLPAFEAAVYRGHVGAVMTSYNLLNGEHTSQNRMLLHDVLETEWGFDGIVMSDWGATYDGVAAAHAGLSLEMPLGRHMNTATLMPALTDGRLNESEIDDKVRRLLRKAIEFHLLDRWNADVQISRYRPAANSTARNIAEQGIVLLKNERGVLPLDGSVHKIAVIGPNAWPLVASGGGSSHVSGWTDHSLVEALQEQLGKGTTVFYDRGIPSFQDVFASTEFTFLGKRGLQESVFGTTTFTGQSVVSRVTSLEMSPGQRASVHTGKERSVRWQGQYIAATSGQYFVYLGTDPRDLCRVYVNDAEVLASERHEIVSPPAWRLITLPTGAAAIRLDCVTKLLSPEAGLGLIAKNDLVRKEAKELAMHSDAVILSVGFDNATEFEGMDRTFSLPAGQDELIRSMTSANRRAIVVLTGGGDVDMSQWIDAVPGLLSVWYPGEQGGAALSEILIGRVNPSGKLPVSFDKALEENPSYSSYYPAPGSREVRYREGIFSGYRFYTSRGVQPRFPFGFGLSYTHFSFENLRLNRNTMDREQLIEASVDLRNDGSRAGAEVTQLYLGCRSNKVPRPVKELKGFHKVELAAGEGTTVHFTINRRDASYYSADQHDWVAEAGECRITVGNSSQHTPLEATFLVKP